MFKLSKTRLLSFIFPQKIFSFYSPVNGEIKVIQSFGRYFLEAGGLMQSGPFLETIYAKAFKKGKFSQKNISKVLILGLGGGSMAKVLQKFYPQAQILGNDIDKYMVEAGKKYLGLDAIKNLKIHIADASDLVRELLKSQKRFDFVFIDLYQGYKIPKFVASTEFLRMCHSLLQNQGNIVFNRLYDRKHQNETDLFLDNISKIFQDVDSFRSYSNLFVCVR